MPPPPQSVAASAWGAAGWGHSLMATFPYWIWDIAYEDGYLCIHMCIYVHIYVYDKSSHNEAYIRMGLCDVGGGRE